jgi:Flp pilus assembly protein TadG
MMIWFYRLRKRQQGQTLVEFALVMPILILILFGILEFGRIFFSYIVITNAAREGARAGAVGKPDAEIITTVFDASPLPQRDTKLQVTKVDPGQGYRTPGIPLTVEVSYNVDLITPLFAEILPNPMTLKTQAVMRVE